MADFDLLESASAAGAAVEGLVDRVLAMAGNLMSSLSSIGRAQLVYSVGRISSSIVSSRLQPDVDKAIDAIQREFCLD